ncbi:MAG: 3-dehydroquinate dehydratase [Gaiellaceae bacterium]|nr:3-dehydroquinate dehydratase [Gaiellaceae bacterium]
MRIAVLNGANLNVLGRRDPSHYGNLTLPELETQIYRWAQDLKLTVRCRQTNDEGEYIGWCHDVYDWADGVIVNPGAWTHYSWALHDALELLQVPLIEVHLSNVDAREEWRRLSVLEGMTAARIVGKGPEGYREALEFLAAKETP